MVYSTSSSKYNPQWNCLRPQRKKLHCGFFVWEGGVILCSRGGNFIHPSTYADVHNTDGDVVASFISIYWTIRPCKDDGRPDGQQVVRVTYR